MSRAETKGTCVNMGNKKDAVTMAAVVLDRFRRHLHALAQIIKSNLTEAVLTCTHDLCFEQK